MVHPRDSCWQRIAGWEVGYEGVVDDLDRLRAMPRPVDDDSANSIRQYAGKLDRPRDVARQGTEVGDLRVTVKDDVCRPTIRQAIRTV